LRTREKLEREYTAILDRLNTNTKELVEQSKKQIAALEDERTRQEARKEARINQSDAYMEENASYKKYAWVETRDDGERVIQIDWDAINNISNDKEKENVQEYLSNIEKFEDDINEAEDAIIEIDDAVKEIKERGKDEYFDLEKQIKEALVNDRQKEIDKLSEINDSINDTNSRLLEAMSYSIE
jgi:Mg2+ and Co2+ transporter CorA